MDWDLNRVDASPSSGVAVLLVVFYQLSPRNKASKRLATNAKRPFDQFNRRALLL